MDDDLRKLSFVLGGLLKYLDRASKEILYFELGHSIAGKLKMAESTEIKKICHELMIKTSYNESRLYSCLFRDKRYFCTYVLSFNYESGKNTRNYCVTKYYLTLVFGHSNQHVRTIHQWGENILN